MRLNASWFTKKVVKFTGLRIPNNIALQVTGQEVRRITEFLKKWWLYQNWWRILNIFFSEPLQINQPSCFSHIFWSTITTLVELLHLTQSNAWVKFRIVTKAVKHFLVDFSSEVNKLSGQPTSHKSFTFSTLDAFSLFC